MHPLSHTGSFFALFVLGLIVSPWPLGSNRDWAWPILSVLYLLITLALLYKSPAPRTPHARLTLAAYAALLLWMLWQWFGLPGVLPQSSIDVFETRSEFLKTLTYACLFYSTIQLVRSNDRFRIVAYAIVLVGLAEALFGGIQQLMFDIPRSRGSFPNPNHFAGYLEMAIGLGIGLMLAGSTNQTDKRFSIIDFVTGPLGRLRLIIVIMVIALVMSRSRMGNVAFFSAVLITAGMSFYYSRTFHRYTAIVLISILALDALIIGNYFGIERLGERLRNTNSESSMRVDLLEYNFTIFKDHLWQGSGAGTYESIFPSYRDATIPRKAVHAEMDYIELLIELGIIGTLPLIIILATGLHAQVRLLGSMSATFDRGIAFGCLTGTVSLLIHGFADVNLQIPSNALLFVLLLALPVAILESRFDSFV
ncbi:MAG: O-antigen ligase family protein, partial [Gammaproteobacteria bacterium]|nr:O-antigen ligase family protein [Gammaproteobacteria bacterium]